MIINMNGAKAPETPSPTLQEKTVTPETLPTVIGADEGYDGLSQVTVNPDSQLIPTNIRSGKTVFGVEGSFVGEPTGGIDLLSLSTSIETIERNYVSGINLAISIPDIALSDCVTSETTEQSPLPTCNLYSNYLASIYDGGTAYAFTNKPIYFSAGSYKPRNVYTYTGIHFDVPEQTVEATVMRGDYGDCANKHLQGKYGIVPIVGAKTSESGISANNILNITSESNIQLPEVDIDTITGNRNTYGQPITITIPAFTLDCGAYNSNKYTLYNNKVGLTLMLYPMKAVIS